MSIKSSFFRIFLMLWGLGVCSGNVWAAASAQGDPDALRREAAGVFARLDQLNNFIDQLSLVDMNQLPVGLKRTVSNVEYALAVSSIQFFAEYAELAVWGRVIIPQGEEGDKVLFFGAQGIRLSNEGDIVGDARLVLLGDIGISVCHGAASLILKGGINLSSGLSNGQTYMSIDCIGFRELGLTADLVLSEKLVRKVDEKGKCDSLDAKVSASFTTIVQDWNDMLLSLSLPPFEIKGLTGFIFKAPHAVFDFSDTRGSDHIQYPAGYQEQYMIPGSPNLWKGIYMDELSVTLPPQFVSRQDSNKRISFLTHHMIFDNNGISGHFKAVNLLPYADGVAGSWPFSVDAFSIELMANHLCGAGFEGKIGLPVADKSPLNYEACISPGNEYLMKVVMTEKMDFSIWAAQAELLPNSYIQLQVKEGKFRPEAMLSGSMGMSLMKSADENGKPVAEFRGINFRRLHLKTEAPYLMVDYLGYDGDISLNGFPLSVSHIALQTKGTEAALGFDAQILLGKAPFAMGAETRLEVVGNLKKEKGLQTWKYKRIDVGKIALDASMAGSFSIRGGLMLNNDDPVYGDGFVGHISMTLDCLEGMEIKSRAIFGKKDFRYWLVDGSATFGKAGVPVFPPVTLNGIGGGAYYRMAQRSIGESALPSGTVYVPDEKRGLGLKSAVVMNIGGTSVISGEASFEIAFNHKGGLAYMGFFGQAKVLGEIPALKRLEDAVKDKLGSILGEEMKFLEKHPGIADGLDKLQKLKLYQPTEAATEIFKGDVPLGQSGFMAALGIQYDFTQKTLHSNFDIYINVMAGMLKGRGKNNCAGHCVLHVSPDDWYFYLGTPSNRLGVELNLAGLLKMKSGAYFMTGTQLEGSPPPPRQVADILGVDIEKLDYMRDLNALGKGGGFAFGTDFSAGTGDITFLILYANFQAGLGFDIMLRDYGEMQCKGHRGPVGIDGWYANGQAYAYLQGECGVNLRLFFVKKKIPIIKAGAATLFQAKLPNPAWFKGYLGVKFNLLGGLVKGNIRLKLTFGEECELMMPGGSPLGFPVISSVQPEDQTKEVDVFAAPQVAFNMVVGKSFELEEDRGPATYRLTLDKFEVTDAGQVLPGELKWNAGRDAVSFYSHDVLPPEKTLKVKVRVGFEEWRNGQWEVVYTGGQKAYEEREITFTTGTAPDIIPMTNIEYAYPVAGQSFYFQGETSKGYVRLKRGQPYLFTAEFEHRIRFGSEKQGKQEVALNYDAPARTLKYSVPQLVTKESYEFEVITLSKGDDAKSGGVSYRQQQLGEDGNDITVRQAQAEGEVRTDVGKVILGYHFATSAYPTLADKIRAIKVAGSSGWREGEYFHLRTYTQSMEPFDQADLTGNEYTAGRPLLEKEAVPDDPFYLGRIYPMIYEQYPYGDVTIGYRDVEEYGVPPLRAIRIMPDYLEEVEKGNFYGSVRVTFPFTYDLYEIYLKDHSDLRNRVVNRYLYTSTLHKYDKLINGYVPVFPSGKYHTRVRFRQPDGTAGSQAVFEYIY